MLGVNLDRGKSAQRWEKWRPTIALCTHEDLVFDRLEILHQPKFERMAAEIAEDIGSISPETEVRLHHVCFDDPWDFEQVYAALHDFARGYSFQPEEEDYLVHMTTGTHVAQICLYLLAETRFIPAQLIQTSPPKRGDPDPGRYTIIDLDLSKYDKIASRFAEQERADLSFLKAGIDTRNAAFNRLIERLERVAVASTAPILITGHTGVGKSQLARRIYQLKRSHRQFEGALIEVNCATLRGDNAMSTLFGHVRGAFTGAVQARTGLLRRADGGLLFLDEIAELGLDEQAMLLRALEEKTFLPVGADKEVTSDFQLLAGTNRNLGTRVKDGLFREDLLARINLWAFELPALRERPEDVEPNLDYELRRMTEATGRNFTLNGAVRSGRGFGQAWCF
jgi:transcriptional regulatory protein RtcR